MKIPYNLRLSSFIGSEVMIKNPGIWWLYTIRFQTINGRRLDTPIQSRLETTTYASKKTQNCCTKPNNCGSQTPIYDSKKTPMY